MIILLTGSEGFVGKSLQKELKINGHEVIKLDRLKKNKKKYINFDLSSKNLKPLINKLSSYQIDLIIHCAAAKGDFMLSDDDFYNDNFIVTKSIIKILNKLNIKKIIHYSTVSVYGHNNQIKDECAELLPNNQYGKTKLLSEKLLIKWQKKYSTDLTILRPSVIYGVNNFANMYNLLSNLNKKYPISIGDGNYIKSITALENIIDITLFCIERLDKLKIYNCTDEPYINLSELYLYISEVDGFNRPKIKINYFVALFLALPFEFMSFILKKDFKINRERIRKFNKSTDYRSQKIRNDGYVQNYETKERIKKMANWYLKFNNK